MKRFLLSAFFMMGVLYTQAQTIAAPQPSPTQTLTQNFSVGTVELSYSRPGLKGRKLGVELAPYGKVWRTGANNATTLKFSDDVTIGGTLLKAGKYGVLSIPGATEWTLIITKDLNVTQPDQYNPANDVVRVKAIPVKLGNKVETLTINFGNITGTACELQLMWDNTLVALPISIDTDAKVMKQIGDIFDKDNKPYYAAAQYYYDNGKDLTKAKDWIDKATTDPANAKAFYIFLLKARIYQKMGNKAVAKATAEKTIALATEAKNDEYVKMAQDVIKAL
jgi:tetratricopeptide (TPR) repeat protein